MTHANVVRHAAAFVCLAVLPVVASGQGTAGGFVPGGRAIVDLEFSGTAIGEFPKGLRLLQGNLEVVDKNGMHMLRASSPSEFVLQLPEVLPPKFTLEFELIPKTCCNPVDLMVEGVISGSRSSVSAQLEWHPGHFAVVGGNPTMFQMDMPAAIAATLPAQLTQVAVSFDDETVKMYTNGRRLYTLSDRKFVRGRVLRISLGGQDDDKYAVYLARVRVADAAATAAVIASNAPQAGPRSVSPMPASQPNAVTPPPAASASTVPAGFNITVTPAAGGPVVSWPSVATASGYTVNRYKIDDLSCCSTSSGRGWLSGLSWQDTPLPVTGRYVYLVLAATPAGQLRGQATFDYVMPSASTAVTPPIASSLGTVPSGFNVSVTMGASGPLVSWTTLPNTTRYAVDRTRIGDTCCGSSSGRATITSPWQDAPLPMSGTYEYMVTAYTPSGQVFGFAQFGFRLPGGAAPSQPAPVNGVLVSPTTTGTITPMTAPTTGVLVTPTTTGTATPIPAGTSTAVTSPTATAPTSGTTTLNPNQTAVIASQPVSGNAPANIRAISLSPLAARVYWDWPVNASQYDIWYSVSRAVAGTTNWTQLTPSPLKDTFVLDDMVPDYRQTYTYMVTATHLNGTSASASADYTPRSPADPANFKAQVTGPGEVLLTWSGVSVAAQYFLTGPGMGNGIVTDGLPVTGGPHYHTYILKGLSPGTHTWHVATSYQPGGVMTAPAAWSVTSATLGVTTGKYMITVESIKSNIVGVDNFLNVDGVGNEVQVTADVTAYDKLGGVTLNEIKSSAVYGDITNFAPPLRIQSGQGRPNGGIGSGDVISPVWEFPQLGATGFTRLVLWQGQLTDGEETVKVVPMIWEWDDGHGVSYLLKKHDFLRRTAETLDLSLRTASGDISNVLRSEPWYISNGFIIYPGAMFTDFVQDFDRPIGAARDANVQFGDPDTQFYPIAIEFTQSVAEAALAGAYGAPGLIPIRFVDHLLGSKSTQTIPWYGNADYTLTLRIDRIP